MGDIKPGDKLKPGAALDWLREDERNRFADQYGFVWLFERVSQAYLIHIRNRCHVADMVEMHTVMAAREVTVL